jgi:hypothetical protein
VNRKQLYIEKGRNETRVRMMMIQETSQMIHKQCGVTVTVSGKLVLHSPNPTRKKPSLWTAQVGCIKKLPVEEKATAQPPFLYMADKIVSNCVSGKPTPYQGTSHGLAVSLTGSIHHA